jgi:exo-1,4-beta-D-glucosaminidase
VQYSYDDRSVVVVNSYYEAFRNLKLTVKVYNLDLTPKFTREASLAVKPDSSIRAFQIPPIQDLTTSYFLDLRLEDGSGKLVSSNFYWLSTKPDVLNWAGTTWYYTPIESYADFTNLKDLPRAELKLSGNVERQGDAQVARVTVQNPSSHLAFFIHLQVTKGQGGDEVLPVLWDSNYFPLMPGESHEISATYLGTDVLGSNPVVEVDGWNVSPAWAALIVR